MIPDPNIFVAVGAAVVAGFVRGFTGFGAALIFMPVASAVLGPQVAAPVFLTTDFVLTLPFLVRAIGHAAWKTVLPAALAALLTVPIGAYLLANGDPISIRWAISVIALMLLAVLASGVRYHRAPRPIPSTGVGAVAGILGGVGQLTGPPVIVYWVSGPDPVNVIRANMFCFFAITSIASFAAYFGTGLFTWEVGEAVLVLAPAYALALYAGSHIFHRHEGRGYRFIAYAVVLVAAITTMPVFDSLIDW